MRGPSWSAWPACCRAGARIGRPRTSGSGRRPRCSTRSGSTCRSRTANGCRLLEQVRGAGADLEQAERLAREDIRLAGQAQSELAEAARSIEQARSYFAMGVGADTSARRGRARPWRAAPGGPALRTGDRDAGQAQQAARRAHQDAMQQASWRQMQADADQRRWQGGSGGSALGDALATGAAVAAGVILQNVIQGAASGAESAPSPPAAPEPMVSPEPPASDTGVGTWQSDSGQGTW